jgi:hypothetical protein
MDSSPNDRRVVSYNNYRSREKASPEVGIQILAFIIAVKARAI